MLFINDLFDIFMYKYFNLQSRKQASNAKELVILITRVFKDKNLILYEKLYNW